MSKAKFNIDSLRDAIDADRDMLCSALGIKKDGARWFCPFCQDDGVPHADGDFSTQAGFRCFKCDWHGDGFTLIRAIRDGNFSAAVAFAQSTYQVQEQPARSSRSKQPVYEKKTHSTIDAAVKAATWKCEKDTGHKWIETRRDVYRNGDGSDVAAVVRFDRSDGATDAHGKPIKTFRPVHSANNGWRTGDPPGKWPLFMLPELLASRGPVYVSEGEKAACAGKTIGLTSTTSAHGGDSPGRTDWTPLASRDVILLPDHDEKGQKYVDMVAAILTDLDGSAHVRILKLPDLPKKGDIADFCASRPEQAHASIRAEVKRLADAATPYAPLEKPPLVVHGTARGRREARDPVATARSGDPYAMTDLGNAERLVALHGDEFLWDVPRKMWRIWDGSRWALDSALRANALAAETARNIRQEAAAAPSGHGNGHDTGQDLFKHAVKSESRNRLAAMLEVAKSQPGVAVAAAAFDADPWLLNMLNGTLDLRAGRLRPHDRADLLTKITPVEYHPESRCKRLEGFFQDVTHGDKDLLAFLQVVAGYTLTGDTSEEKIFLIHGPEASGKTTFLEMLRTCLGEYAVTIQAEILAKRRNGNGASAPTPELARLAGVRLAAGSEMEQGRDMAEALTKNLSGGEVITARHLNSEFFDFLPQFKLWLSLNHCPKVSADDGAIWRRILRIGFEHSVPHARLDRTLKPYLRDPEGGAPAFLAWAVEGCLRWQREGLKIPAAVVRSTNAYREESDPLAAFIKDCVRFSDGKAWESWGDLWQTYNEHAEQSGTPERLRATQRQLQDRLKARGCSRKRRHEGHGWCGIVLLDEWTTAESDPVTPSDPFFEESSTKRDTEKKWRNGGTEGNKDTLQVTKSKKEAA